MSWRVGLMMPLFLACFLFEVAAFAAAGDTKAVSWFVLIAALCGYFAIWLLRAEVESWKKREGK